MGWDPVAYTLTEDTAYVEKILGQLAEEFSFRGEMGILTALSFAWGNCSGRSRACRSMIYIERPTRS